MTHQVQAAPTTCGWCTASLESTQSACPVCNASAPRDDIQIPGLTTMPAELLVFQARFEQRIAVLSTKRVVQLFA